MLEGPLNLGGEISWLHRDRPSKKRRACMKDGDLGCHTQKRIVAKGPLSVQTRKAKGRATADMLKEGMVRQEE